MSTTTQSTFLELKSFHNRVCKSKVIHSVYLTTLHDSFIQLKELKFSHITKTGGTSIEDDALFANVNGDVMIVTYACLEKVHLAYTITKTPEGRQLRPRLTFYCGETSVLSMCKRVLLQMGWAGKYDKDSRRHEHIHSKYYKRDDTPETLWALGVAISVCVL